MTTVKTITLPLEDLDREDGITSFTSEFEQHPDNPNWKQWKVTSFSSEFEEHPGRKMWKEYIQAYAHLEPLEQAQHKIANSQTYINYVDAMRLGVHIYNHRTNGGQDDTTNT